MAKQSKPARLPVTEPTTTATHKGPWTHIQNPVIVAAYFRLAMDKKNGPLPRGEQAARSRATMAIVNAIGPNRGHKFDMKFQNISACLIALGRADLVCHGFKPLAHTQTDRTNPEFDSHLWKSIDSAIALADAGVCVGALS